VKYYAIFALLLILGLAGCDDKTNHLVDQASTALGRNDGRYQMHKDGGRTWRLDTTPFAGQRILIP